MPPKTQKNNYISIIWDFDGTLTAQDSTTDLIQTCLGKKQVNMENFWKMVKTISRVSPQATVNSISTSETAAWMYALSEITESRPIPLDQNFDKSYMMAFAKNIKLYPNVLKCLKKIKNFSKKQIYKRNKIEIHHFIITAGLQDLVSAVFKYNKNLITETFGCKYHAVTDGSTIKNIPIYCMDKTSKTRSLFEINKGCFIPETNRDVDDLIENTNEWCHFENMIYIGDGVTDIPAFSLVKSRRGMTIGVYNPSLKKNQITNKTKKMKSGKRIDLLTPAKFSLNGKLYKTIEARCTQIVDRYNSQN